MTMDSKIVVITNQLELQIKARYQADVVMLCQLVVTVIQNLGRVRHTSRMIETDKHVFCSTLYIAKDRSVLTSCF